MLDDEIEKKISQFFIFEDNIVLMHFQLKNIKKK